MLSVEAPLPPLQRIWAHGFVRRLVIVAILGTAWEVYARWLDNPLIFPTLSESLRVLWTDFENGQLPDRLSVTLRILLMGYGLGVILAMTLTALAMSFRFTADLLSTLAAMFNPMPAIALLPLSLLWFGLGAPSLIFVIIHSVLWAVALNALSGFLAVSETLRMAGQTFGLRGLRFVTGILIPAAFPAILSGLKIGWAFGWRTLVAAELVFGVSSGQGGIGWYIYEKRNMLETPGMFAGLITIMIFGLLVEMIFLYVERLTVRRWGMQR
jgi:NitT/TauT family transport system permease protein